MAATGRPGPVLVDIPKDITAETAEFKYPENVTLRSYNPINQGHSGQINKALDLLVNAKKPMVYSGGGVILGDASEALTEFIKLLDFPITNTLMGLGGFPASHENFLGMLGMHGTYQANMAMQECDVLLAVGARFDDRVIGNPDHFLAKPKKIIHIDIDPASIAKIVPVDVPIVGPVDTILAELDKQVVLQSEGSDRALPDPDSLNEWWTQINSWREAHGLWHGRRYAESELIMPQDAIKALYTATRGEAYVTSDVGQHQMFAAQYYKFDYPRRWINSGGLGTMGFGLPAAMGIKIALPDADVACVTGEGSIQMNIQELSTCSQYACPVKIINLRNNYLGMVKQWQDMQYDGRYSESHYAASLPDFVKLAEAYGHVGMEVKSQADLEPAMKEAFALKDRLVFMDIHIDPDEHVYPMMVAPNGAMKDMLLSKTERS